tara:strand:- start:12924 stop:13079 length:156 start_codon:yes stop_codon:yes gene_type:complete
MTVEIDFNKKEITIEKPTTIKELTTKFKGMDISEFKIVTKITSQFKYTMTE